MIRLTTVCALLLGTLIFLISLPSYGDAAEQEEVALELGQAAPFAGVLLSEAAAVAWARLRIDVDYCRAQLAGRDRLLAGADATRIALERELGEARSTRPTSSFWEEWDGPALFALGVLAAGAAVYAALAVLDSRST